GLGQQRGLGEVDLNAAAGRFDIADVYQAGERRRPETSDRSAAGIERQVVSGALIEPAWRHHPGVIALEVALLRARDGGLVPGMALVDGVAERVAGDKGLRSLPVVVIGAPEKNANVEINVDEGVSDQFSVDDHSGS